MRHHKRPPLVTHLKFWMLRYSFMFLMAVLAVLLALGILAYCHKGAGELPWQNLLAIYASLTTFGYFLVSHHRKQTDLLLELINRFHERYAKIFGDGKPDWQNDDKLEAYLDLCGEEYYWYCQGHIPPEVWDTWCAGMRKHLCENKAVREGAKKKLGACRQCPTAAQSGTAKESTDKNTTDGTLYCGLTWCVICDCCCYERK